MGISLADPALRDATLSPALAAARADWFRAIPEVCVERARLVTRFHVEHGLLGRATISPLDKARCHRFVLGERTPIVRHERACARGPEPFSVVDRSPFAGATTSKWKGVPLYPELLALTLWPELWTLSTRAQNPFAIRAADAEELDGAIFPRWIRDTILERTRATLYAEGERATGQRHHAPALELLEHLVFFLASKPNTISHCIPDFQRVVRRGLRALVDEAAERRAHAGDAAKEELYGALVEALEGVITWGRRLADRAAEMAGAAADPDEARALAAIAEAHRRAPELPARTFREGLTAIWVCWTALHLENANVGLSLGRLDQVLFDLYRDDVAAGRLTPEAAVELCGWFFLKLGDHAPMVPAAAEQLFGGTGSNQAITLGGVDRDGRDAVNDLSLVMLRATELMKLRDPNVNARYLQGENPKAWLRRLCEANVATGATPAIHNDRAVIEALGAKGDALPDARDYGVIGCVEPGVAGRFFGHSGALLVNLAAVLELSLWNGRHRQIGLDRRIGPRTGAPSELATFDDLRRAVAAQIEWMAEQATTLNDAFGRTHQAIYPTPLLSALFDGPMESGRDVTQGGAALNGSGVTIVGLADVADSLAAIRRVVYEERALSLADLLAALERDFAGDEALAARLANPTRTPKFGNEDPLADGEAEWLVRTLDETFGARTNYRGGRYRVGYWTMTMHAGYGRLSGALPNGRRAGANFSSGITPESGLTPSLWPALRSVGRQPAACLANGAALNLKYTPTTGDRAAMLDRFVASVEAAFDPEGRPAGGGPMEIQFNVTDHATFLDAAAHPERYPDLLVRVSGYTAYFKDLNPQMRKEIIDRSEYLLATGAAEPFPPWPLPTASAGSP